MFCAIAGRPAVMNSLTERAFFAGSGFAMLYGSILRT
jgi:hypothetical protein